MKLPQPGDVFEKRYKLVEQLGEGGFAVVYRATDSTARPVALKILKPERDGYSNETQSRFTREVQILAALQNPHTVRLYDYGRGASGLLFMVFEYLPGRDLADILAETDRLEPAVALHVLRQVALSLQEAHNHGLLHRDLKPANIRIHEAGGDRWRAKLLDFGIARPALRDASSITQTGELVGTPRYMSPEQLMDAELTPASDVYSLGLVALEMVVGQAALSGNSWGAQLDRLQTGHTFSIPEVERIGVPMMTVIERMSARHIEDRYQSMTEVLNAFDRVRRGESIPPVTAVYRSSTSSQSAESAASQSLELAPDGSDTTALKAALVVLLLLTVVAALFAYDKFRDRSEPATPRASTERVLAPSFIAGEPDVSSVADTADTRQASDVGVKQPPDLPIDFGSGGCGRGAEYAGRFTNIDDRASMKRTLYVPSDYEPHRVYPLVVVFHEDWQSTERFLYQTEFADSAEERGYVLLAPQGDEDLPWRSPQQISPVKAVVDDAMDRVCIDPDRVFLVGHGSGGNAAERLSCEGWASAAVTISYRPGRNEQLCDAPAVRHLQFHAIESQRMPFNGGGSPPCAPQPKMSVAELEDHWRRRNRCRTKGRETIKQVAGTCVAYDCGTDLVSCRLIGGHGFPGGTRESPLNALCEPQVANFPARRMIFEFLDAQPN